MFYFTWSKSRVIASFQYTDCNIPYLKPFILEHLLYSDELAAVAQLGLVDDAEAAIADELHIRVAHLQRPVGALPRRRHHRRHLGTVLAWNTNNVR